MSSKNKTAATKEEARPALEPKLRFPEFRGAEGWKTHPLGEVCKLYQSETIASSEFVEDGEHLVYGANGVVGRYGRYNHEAEEVVVSCRGNCGEVHLTKPQSWITGNSMVVSPKAKDLNKQFLFWLLGASNLKPIISGSAQPQITRQGFAPFKVSIPVPAEQRKIAECLSSVDELIGARARKVEALKTHKKGLMQQLFPREGETQPRLRFPAFKNAGDWASDSLGNIFETTSGGTPSRTEKSYWNGDIPWVTTSLVDCGVITSAAEFLTAEGLKNSSAKLFPNGTVLMAMYGQGKTRGQVALLGIKAATNQACAAILPRKDIDPYFVFLNLAGRYDEIREMSNSGGQENLSQGLIREIQFTFPPNDDEQRKVTACLSSLDALITAETQKLETLKTHKKGLMQQLFPSPQEVDA